MKLNIQKDLDLTQMRLSHASSFMADSRMQSRKKSSIKSQQSRRKQAQKLRKMIQKQKVQQIKKQFINKLKLLVPHRQIPPKLLTLRKQPSNLFDLFILKLTQKQGLKMGASIHLIWKFIVFFKVIAMLVTISLMIAFEGEGIHHQFNKVVELFILVNSADIIMNLFVQKCENNRNLKNLLMIWTNYVKNDFGLDCITLLLSAVLLYYYIRIVVVFLLFFTLIKLWRSVHNIQVLEHLYIANMSHEKYWAILRVLLFNFVIAHFIAITVILMSRGENQTNWIKEKGIQNSQWPQKYVWAYYWAVNIMLTVGFGDISATNKTQALVLIFVQTISCIIFAYNINTVGSILTDIKQKERERKNQLRILLKMAQQNQIQSDIVEQAVNYVDESFKIKQKFFYEDHDAIIQTLPQTLQPEYRKHVNKKMLLQLPLTNFFSHKSLLKISQIIYRKLAHPQQIIWKKNEPLRLIILNKGKIGLSCRRRGNCILNGQIIQSLQVNSNKSKLLTTNFFRNQRFQYDVKSVKYSVLYHLSNQDFASALSQKSMDYQYFCVLRDRAEFRLEDRELDQCSFCPQQKHNCFNCPKMHLILIKNHITLKQARNSKKQYMKRYPYIRNIPKKQLLKHYKILKAQQQSYLNIIQQENKKLCSNITYPSLASNQIISEKRTLQSLHSNIFRENQIHRLNSLLVAKFNQQEMCVGFWNLQCDVAYNWKMYFKCSNPDGFALAFTSVGGGKAKISRLNSIKFENLFSQ